MRSYTAQPLARVPPHSACLLEAYARLSEAHTRAGRHGKPLLTADGENYLRGVLGEGSAGHFRTAVNGQNVPPRWEAEARRLWLGNRLLKVFRQPAPHQAQLLSAFQDHSWTQSHVDDPLPLGSGETPDDAKRRLHETVRNLNRGLPPGTIRFRGDGTGEGVTWEYDLRPAGGNGHEGMRKNGRSYPKATP
jgi:hypothetical protein